MIYQYSVTLMFIFLTFTGAPMVCGGTASDAVSREAASAVRLEQAVERYKLLAKVDNPQLKDIKLSLRRRDPTGRSYAEVFAALDLIGLGYFENTQELIEPVRDCYEKSVERPLLQAACASAMLRLDPEHGLRLARYVLDDRKVPTEAKLYLVRALAEVGHPDGFSFLVETLKNGTQAEYDRAVTIAEVFRPLDGMKVPGTAETVAVDAALQEAAEQRRHPATTRESTEEP